MIESHDGGPARLNLAERALVQAGPDAHEAVGLRPGEHFEGARHPAGRGIRLSIRPGFDLSAFELEVDGQPAVNATTQPCLAIVVLLSGHGEGRIGQDGAALPPTPYRAGNLYVSFARRPVTGRGRAFGDERFRLIEFRLSLDFLDRVGLRALFEGFDQRHGFHHASGDGLWLGIAPAPPAILEEAEALLRDAMGGGADLRVEAGALRLFDAATELMRNADPGVSSDRGVARDQARLESARAAMCGDLARPWLIEELARLVGLNTRRLKEGYRDRFGRPVHADLQAMRMEQGQALLRQGRTVTETSLAVGYANPSHFARLFRRHFGIPPRACR